MALTPSPRVEIVQIVSISSIIHNVWLKSWKHLKNIKGLIFRLSKVRRVPLNGLDTQSNYMLASGWILFKNRLQHHYKFSLSLLYFSFSSPSPSTTFLLQLMHGYKFKTPHCCSSFPSIWYSHLLPHCPHNTRAEPLAAFTKNLQSQN